LLCGLEQDEEKMKFVSYRGAESYELPDGIQARIGTGSVTDFERARRLHQGLTIHWATGESPGFTCRGFFTERNIKTGEIRISYSEVLGISGEDIK